MAFCSRGSTGSRSTSPRRKIVRYQLLGFALIILISWMDELVGLSALLTGKLHQPDYREALTETVFTLLVAIPITWMSRRFSNRLFYLETLMHICGWCGRVQRGDEWTETKTSHGICPHCLKRLREGSS
jgi:hypothetical protein